MNQVAATHQGLPARRSISVGLLVAAAVLVTVSGCSEVTKGHSLRSPGDVLPVESNTPSPPVDVKIGDSAKTPRGDTITVFSYQAPVAYLDAGMVLAAIDAQICARAANTARTINTASTSGPFVAPGASPRFFSLQLADGTVHPAEFGSSVTPNPSRPGLSEQELGPGECARGWVQFQIPGTQPATYVVLRSLSTIRWRIS